MGDVVVPSVWVQSLTPGFVEVDKEHSNKFRGEGHFYLFEVSPKKKIEAVFMRSQLGPLSQCLFKRSEPRFVNLS